MVRSQLVSLQISQVEKQWVYLGQGCIIDLIRGSRDALDNCLWISNSCHQKGVLMMAENQFVRSSTLWINPAAAAAH